MDDQLREDDQHPNAIYIEIDDEGYWISYKSQKIAYFPIVISEALLRYQDEIVAFIAGGAFTTLTFEFTAGKLPPEIAEELHCSGGRFQLIISSIDNDEFALIYMTKDLVHRERAIINRFYWDSIDLFLETAERYFDEVRGKDSVSARCVLDHAVSDSPLVMTFTRDGVEFVNNFGDGCVDSVLSVRNTEAWELCSILEAIGETEDIDVFSLGKTVDVNVYRSDGDYSFTVNERDWFGRNKDIMFPVERFPQRFNLDSAQLQEVIETLEIGIGIRVKPVALGE